MLVFCFFQKQKTAPERSFNSIKCIVAFPEEFSSLINNTVLL